MIYRYIAIEGNIGAGKTTLAKKLADSFNGKLILERFEENPFLPEFYKQPGKYAFQVELSFLADRFQQVKEELSKPEIFHDLIISDYFFPKTLIFAKVNLREDEATLFARMFSMVDFLLPKPELIVYLYHDIEKLKKNISTRGRGYEAIIKEEYLSGIHTGYMEYFHHHPELRIVIVDVNRINFADNEEDYRFMADLISRDYQPGITRIDGKKV